MKDALKGIPNANIDLCRAERCHRLGQKLPNRSRPIICCFTYYADVSFILENRKSLKRGVYVNEDLPELWSDARKLLRPVHKAAKQDENLRNKTNWSKDCLQIDGRMFSETNIQDAKGLVDLESTCEKRSVSAIVFLGALSIFSNIYRVLFDVDGQTYCSNEQYIQASKAALFGDDEQKSKIMSTTNPFAIKRLGSKVCNYDAQKWKEASTAIVYRGLKEKFSQHLSLKQTLISTGGLKIAEASKDKFWGTGVSLHDRLALREDQWYGDGKMCELYSKLKSELR